MSDAANKPGLEELTRDLPGPGAPLSRLWRGGSHWQVSLRWAVPPSIVSATLIAPLFGCEVDAVAPILATALVILAYNVVFFAILRVTPRDAAAPPRDAAAPTRDQRRELAQVGLDYAAMLVLLHATGGVASPLLFFFVFHVIFAAILFRELTAYLFAAAASLAVSGLGAAEAIGLLPHHPVRFHGVVLNPLPHPAQVTIELAFFTATVFITAAATSAISTRLRARMAGVAAATARVARLNDRMRSLYAMTRAVGSSQHLGAVLQIVTAELAVVLGVPAVTVKLLSEDGQVLRYVAAHGMPEGFVDTHRVEVAESPLNRRIIEGETLVFGRIDPELRLHAELAAAGLQSLLLAPLTVEGKVIGILGAYRANTDAFDDDDVSFFTLSADVVAIAIEAARQHEAIEALLEQRTHFMLKVAHNLRSPVTAGAGMLEAVLAGYLGAVTPQQEQYLQRVVQRLKAMSETVGALLNLAEGRRAEMPLYRGEVQPARLAQSVRDAFAAPAEQKGITLEVALDEHLGAISGDEAMLESALENLVSNALKYTPCGGRVSVSFSAREPWLVVEVRDTGIGIPAGELPRLFEEFFRASNAKKLVELGTGLGLAIVKQTVERHGGAIRCVSTEGEGTVFTLELPIAEPARPAPGSSPRAAPAPAPEVGR